MNDKPVDPVVQWRDVRAKAADGRVVGSAIPCVAGDALCSAYELKSLRVVELEYALREAVTQLERRLCGGDVHLETECHPTVRKLRSTLRGPHG